MQIAEQTMFSCQNNNIENKRGSLPSHRNYAKHNEKAFDSTIMKAAIMINKIMLI